MQRTGFLPIVHTVLLVLILGLVALAMVMFDRQHDTLKAIDANLTRQADTLVRLSDDLRARPAATAAATPAGPTDLAEVFARQLAPRDLPGYASGDWLVDTTNAQIGKLSPVIPADLYQSNVESKVLESLITRDPETLAWKPWIAESWDVSEDGLTIGFDLRDGVTFSDGEPLDADDVVFTLNFIQNPRINAPQLASYYENVVSVEAEGPRRVVFTLSEPYFLSLSITGGMGILAEHWYGRFDAEEYNQSLGFLFGSGPYRLDGDPEAWAPSSSVELVRNERYWGPRPTLDRLVWRTISEENVELTAFRNGETDRYSVSPEKLVQLEDDPGLNEKAQLLKYESASGGYRYLGWNQQRDGKPTPFASRDVRLAMTLLLDREQMAEQLMSGLATVVSGPFSPQSPQYDDSVAPWPHDPAQANALLESAGWEDRDGDGVREDGDGVPFRFQLIYPASSDNYQLMGGYIKDQLAKAGVVVDLEPTEFNTLIQRIQARDFDAITLGWGGTVESDPKQIFHSVSIGDGGDNYVSYTNEGLDRLIDEARVTVDEAERTALWHRVHAILHEDQPYTFLFTRKSVVFVDRRFENVRVTPTGLNDATELFVPVEVQRY